MVLAAGHRAEDGRSAADWQALAKLGQPLILYMPMAQLAEIAASLEQGGLSPDTPAALIQSATTGAEQVVESRLGSLAADAAKHGIGSPAIVVIGAIAGAAPAAPVVAGAVAMTPNGPRGWWRRRIRAPARPR